MTEELTHRQKMLTFGGVLLAMFLGALDQTIVSTALPRIVADLHGLDRFTWVATAYLVASTALVPIYGKLADTYSRRTIEIVAVSVFLLGSMLCGLAGEFGTLPLLGDGMTQLIVFRAVQGLGGAGLFAMAFIVIADLFPPAERGRYQGFVGAVFGTSSVLGPFLGGFLTDNGTGLIPGVAGWRLVFYVNLPLGALALWFILTQMPPLRPRTKPRRLDYLSMLLLVLGLGPLVIGLQLNKNEFGWGHPLTLGLLGGAAPHAHAVRAPQPGSCQPNSGLQPVSQPSVSHGQFGLVSAGRRVSGPHHFRAPVHGQRAGRIGYPGRGEPDSALDGRGDGLVAGRADGVALRPLQALDAGGVGGADGRAQPADHHARHRQLRPGADLPADLRGGPGPEHAALHPGYSERGGTTANWDRLRRPASFSGRLAGPLPLLFWAPSSRWA